MIRHFFLDKTNTIIEGSERNLGLNPILSIGYGKEILRGLIHFDIEEIRELINDKTFADTSKLKFTLKMTNCFSIDNNHIESKSFKGMENITKRASSFDLMLCKLPIHFDAGRGFDYISDFWEYETKSFITNGSNWYSCKEGLLWDGSLRPKSLKKVEGGIWSKDELKSEYQNYIDGKESIIVGTQHFDYGYEHLSIDITKYIFDVLSTNYNSNYGLCLMFVPSFEDEGCEYTNVVNFFNDNTNTFFHPFIEVLYAEYISDDRESFTLGKENKLYLYVSDNGTPTNLDSLPICEINGDTYQTEQSTKGVYFTRIPSNLQDVYPNTIQYDIWSNIVLNGENIDDVELEFAVNPRDRKISIGSNSDVKRNVVPSIYGINDDENVSQGEIREITVDFRERFSSEKKILIDYGEYRLYVKDGNREIDVIEYQPIEKTFLNNFFILYTGDLIPNTYYVDIKIKIGRETNFFKESLRFKIVNNVSNRHQ